MSWTQRYCKNDTVQLQMQRQWKLVASCFMSGGAEISQQTVSFNSVIMSCGMDDLSVHIIKYAVWNVDLRGGNERSEILRVDTTVTCLFNVHLIKSKRGIWSETSPFYILNCQGRCKRVFCFTLLPVRGRRYRLKNVSRLYCERKSVIMFMILK